MTNIKTIPNELQSLWKLQYQPLEKLLYSVCKENKDKETVKKYQKCSLYKKIAILDRAQTCAKIFKD